jgi:hypothetical protein
VRVGLHDLLAVVALLALVVLFNPDLVFRGMVPAGYDTFVYFYPLRAYAGQALAEGRLPLWNPHLFLGTPFLANPQTAVFYPGTWLFALIQTPYAYVGNLLGHMFLAGVSLYAFCRWSLGLARLGGVIGGAAFAFSGFLLGQAGHINQVSVAAWLPAAALSLDLALRCRSVLASAALVAVLVLQLLAGHPQEVYMTLVVLGLLVVWRCWGSGPRELIRGMCVLGVTAALAFGSSAVQLLPTAELTRLGIRGGGLDYEQAIVDALPWQLLLPALLPGYWSHLASTELFGHVGVVVLVLGWVGLLFGSGRAVVLGAVLAAFGLMLALGNTTPFYRLLFDWASGFGSFRVPARWLMIYTFGAAILIAAGTSWVADSTCSRSALRQRLRGLPGGNRTMIIRLVVALAVPLAFAILARVGEPQSRRLLLIWAVLAAGALLLTGIAALVPRLRVPALVVLLLGGLAELWVAGADLEVRHPMPNLAFGDPRESTTFLRSQEGLDGRFRTLSIATPEYEVKETPEYRERYSWLHPEALKNLLVAVKWNETLTPNVPAEYRLDSADGYDGGVLPLAAFVRLTGAMIGEEHVRPDGVLISRLDHLPAARWLDLLGVRYVLAGKIKDVTRDALYYDRALTVTLRPDERLDLTSLPRGDLSRLGIISSYRGPSRSGQEVARLDLVGPGGVFITPLLDGLHTASATADPSTTPSLERVQEWGAGGPTAPGDWVGQIRFPPQPVSRLTIVNTSSDLTLDLRSLNLVDDVRQASFSQVLDDSITRTEFFDMKVYDRRDALPRAYLVSTATVLDDIPALDRLRSPDFDPRDRVVLAPVDGAQTLQGAGRPSGTVTIERSAPEHVRIRVSPDQPSYLVLSDSWYPGWQATVDGRATSILRANVLLRAIPVSAGEHIVEFTYEPTSFRLGVLISAGSAILGVVVWILVTIRGRRVGGTTL